MRFSVFSSVLAAGSFIAGGLAAPMPSNSGSVIPKLSIGQALVIVNNLNEQLVGAAQSVNQTLSKVTGDVEDNAVLSEVGTQVQQMTVFISHATANLTQQISGQGVTSELSSILAAAPQATVQELASALQTTLTTVTGVVGAAPSSLTSGLLAQLTPLTGAVSGLFALLNPVFAQLLPTLKSLISATPLSSLVSGLLGGILGGLNL